MELLPTQVVRPATRVVARRVHGELVVVAMPGFEARVLNPLGAEIWDAVGQGASVATIVRALSHPERPGTRLAEDVCDFLRDLLAEGLLETSRDGV